MLKRSLFVVVLACCLQGCFGAFLAGAAIGSVVVYESSNYKYAKSDNKISSEAVKKLKADPDLYKKSRIVISVYDGIVLLAGQTPSPEYRQRAQQIVEGIPGVKRVYNEITINGPISSMTQSSDAWITTKIKSQMMAAKGIDSDDIKVVTENGVVYLMGKVTRQQAAKATAIARKSSGVQKVVTLFEYITVTST